MLTQKVTENLKANSDWRSLQEYILECIDGLDSLESIDFSKEGALVTAEGRKHARAVLLKILEPFAKEEDEPGDKKAEAASKYGVA
jgi:hypothetical protein